jgi:sarcosine oxidase subunit beta
MRGWTGTADAVVVGGGTVGGWCAHFLRQAGLSRVVLVKKGVLGQGASSRAAGLVRVQGGTPEAVRLGLWSRGFYLRQRDEIGADSGFVTQGYRFDESGRSKLAADPVALPFPPLPAIVQERTQS